MYYNFDIHELIAFTRTLKILYVEDNEDAQKAMLALLGNFFDDIVVATDGLAGLQEFTNSSFHLVISDIRMPNMSGLEMIEKMKSIDPNISIIVATAHKETELLLESITIGVDGYLLKPINYKQLQKTIRKTCEKIYYKKKNEAYELNLEQLIQERTKELEYAKEKLTDIANKDPLTELYNRRYFNEISDMLINISNTHKRAFCILMIDIDRFKMINDTYGHIIGDHVLKELSTILLNLTRQNDVVVRYGGEEFIILLPNTKIDGASSIAQKIHSTIENLELLIDNNILKFTVSIGVTQCDWSGNNNIDTLIHRADESLYEAKRSGRNRVVVYHFQN
jgi:diguanylate cyclase (GGDEF)-like protein